MSEERHCPKCGERADYAGTSTTSTEVVWSDGLGSPGTIDFTYNHYKCCSCGHVWKE